VAPFCLVGGATPVVAPRHCFLGCAGDWKERLEASEDLKAKGLVKNWGHLGLFYRPGEKIVAHIPKNLEGGEVSLANSPSGRLGFKAELYSVD
jgi:hypothetical protein